MTDQQNNDGNGGGKKPDYIFPDGAVSVSMWEEEGKYGNRYPSKVEKSYKNQETGEWHKTQYLTGTEKLQAARMLEQAYQKENELKREQSLSRSQNREVNQAREAYREQSQGMDRGGKPEHDRPQTR